MVLGGTFGSVWVEGYELGRMVGGEGYSLSPLLSQQTNGLHTKVRRGTGQREVGKQETGKERKEE